MYSDGNYAIICIEGEARTGGTYSGFEGNELEDHLHGENASKDHIEDVHGVVKQMRLIMVLDIDRSKEQALLQ